MGKGPQRACHSIFGGAQAGKTHGRVVLTSTKRLLVTRRLPPEVEARAQRDYDVALNEDDHIMGEDELIAGVRDADAALICITEKFTARVFENLPKQFQIVSTFSVGTDHIDLEAARERGIRVGCAPHGVTIATAEIAMLLILGAARRAPEGEQMMRARRWMGWEPMQLLGRRLDGKRLGIFGMGKIGQALAQRARGFEMEVHYHNRRQLPEDLEQGAIFHESLDELLSVSDVLSINAPSTPATRHIINQEAIAKMPEGAIVVNTARGDLVNDKDLIAALKTGRVAYAGLDVYEGEPCIHEAYYDVPNAFLLPHLGSAAWEARNQMGFEALDNIDAIFAGREPPYPVA